MNIGLRYLIFTPSKTQTAPNLSNATCNALSTTCHAIFWNNFHFYTKLWLDASLGNGWEKSSTWGIVILCYILYIWDKRITTLTDPHGFSKNILRTRIFCDYFTRFYLAHWGPTNNISHKLHSSNLLALSIMVSCLSGKVPGWWEIIHSSSTFLQ